MDADLIIPEQNTQALVAVQRGEIDAQIATAKTYPRDPREFIQDAIRWATEDPATAESCMYRLEKGGQVIEGPSVRLAEIAAQAYGNLRVASRLVAEQEKFVVVEAVAHDLEKNNAQRAEVVASIWGKHGRYSQDLVQTTILAAQAKARRNAILAVIPGAWIRKIMIQVEAVNEKTQEALGERVEKLLGWAEARMKIPRARILAALGKRSAEALTSDDLLTIRTGLEEIRDGRPHDEVFPERKAVEKSEAKSVQDMLGDMDGEEEEQAEEPAKKPARKKASKKTSKKASKKKARRKKAPKEEAPKAEQPWHSPDLDEAELTEHIGRLEDAVGERDADGISRAQEVVPNSLDPDADLTVLRSYCDALQAELEKLEG